MTISVSNASKVLDQCESAYYHMFGGPVGDAISSPIGRLSNQNKYGGKGEKFF